ncbi:hypothetical protein [Paenibacillus sp. LjRoot56]|uniref:hypothetical protein n=1 Tax=Paenibacillus sp. LjRoot56 TaxID=3342333 RepID=UPI003ECDE313
MAKGQQVEQTQEQDFLRTEALKIGYNKMISDLDEMLQTPGITDLQKNLLNSQKNEIKKRLGA